MYSVSPRIYVQAKNLKRTRCRVAYWRGRLWSDGTAGGLKFRFVFKCLFTWYIKNRKQSDPEERMTWIKCIYCREINLAKHSNCTYTLNTHGYGGKLQQWTYNHCFLLYVLFINLTSIQCYKPMCTCTTVPEYRFLFITWRCAGVWQHFYELLNRETKCSKHTHLS